MSQSVVIDFLLKRRSVVAQNMTEPGPSEEVLQTILTIGARVPDHGKLHPWRFIIFKDEARNEFGDVLGKAFAAANPGASEEEIAFERGRLSRAPLVVAVISCSGPHVKIPEWEQILSSGAVCQNMLIAAKAQGFAAQWLTEWYAYDSQVDNALGLMQGERVAGYMYFGTPKMPPKERPRPDLNDITTHWQSQ
jgi:nitroreductase